MFIYMRYIIRTIWRRYALMETHFWCEEQSLLKVLVPWVQWGKKATKTQRRRQELSNYPFEGLLAQRKSLARHQQFSHSAIRFLWILAFYGRTHSAFLTQVCVLYQSPLWSLARRSGAQLGYRTHNASQGGAPFHERHLHADKSNEEMSIMSEHSPEKKRELGTVS